MNGQLPPHAKPAELRARVAELESALRREEEERASMLLQIEDQRRAQERLQVIADAIPIPVSYLDTEQRFRFVNRAHESWLGRSRQELHGKHVREVIGEEAYSRVREQLESALSGHTGSADVSLPRADGGSRDASVECFPHLDARGRSRGVVVLLRDVTDSTPSSAVANGESWRQGEELMRAVSHDLRTPLTSIQGYAQLLRRMIQAREPRQRIDASIDHIIASARRMNSMIQDLVDSARLETRPVTLSTRPVHLRALVEDLLEKTGGEMETRRVGIEIPDDLGLVEADPNAMERIITNLLSNALKYSEAESRVLLRAERSGGVVVISITDRGKGIAPEDLPHVFDRFRRVGGPQMTPGLGLGLYITRKLVEAHGGELTAESRLGEGSTFRVTIPAARPRPEGSYSSSR